MAVPTYQQVEAALGEYSQIAFQHWVHDEFLTWKWWLLAALSVLPWFAWWALVDKNRLQPILLFGFFIAICAVSLDAVGTQLLWWGYPDKLTHLSPTLLPADLTLVPVILMLVYQYFGDTWRSFITATVGIAMFNSFVGEPLFMWFHFYQVLKWNLIYSFLTYIATAVLGRLLVVGTSPRGKSSR